MVTASHYSNSVACIVGRYNGNTLRNSKGATPVLLPISRLLDNFRGGGLADRLLVRITYGMAIYQHLSAPASRAKTSEWPTTQPLWAL
jgi:hypothetical protein